MELRKHKLYREGAIQWLTATADMRSRRMDAAKQRMAFRLGKVYDLVERIARHWRRRTLASRARVGVGVGAFAKQPLPLLAAPSASVPASTQQRQHPQSQSQRHSRTQPQAQPLLKSSMSMSRGLVLGFGPFTLPVDADVGSLARESQSRASDAKAIRTPTIAAIAPASASAASSAPVTPRSMAASATATQPHTPSTITAAATQQPSALVSRDRAGGGGVLRELELLSAPRYRPPPRRPVEVLLSDAMQKFEQNSAAKPQTQSAAASSIASAPISAAKTPLKANGAFAATTHRPPPLSQLQSASAQPLAEWKQPPSTQPAAVATEAARRELERIEQQLRQFEAARQRYKRDKDELSGLLVLLERQSQTATQTQQRPDAVAERELSDRIRALQRSCRDYLSVKDEHARQVRVLAAEIEKHMQMRATQL